MAQPEYDYLFNLLVIGDSDVGKTSLILRFADGTSPEEFYFTSTIGVNGADFRIKTIQMGGKTVKLQVWEPEGYDRYSQRKNFSYYRGAHVMIAYDVTDRRSFTNAFQWLQEAERYLDDTACKLFVGTKADLVAQTLVDPKEARTRTEEVGLDFIETSAKTGRNVEAAFTQLTQLILDGVLARQSTATATLTVDSKNSKKKKKKLSWRKRKSSKKKSREPPDSSSTGAPAARPNVVPPALGVSGRSGASTPGGPQVLEMDRLVREVQRCFALDSNARVILKKITNASSSYNYLVHVGKKFAGSRHIGFANKHASLFVFYSLENEEVSRVDIGDPNAAKTPTSSPRGATCGWTCSRCTFANAASASICEMCEEGRAVIAKQDAERAQQKEKDSGAKDGTQDYLAFSLSHLLRDLDGPQGSSAFAQLKTSLWALHLSEPHLNLLRHDTRAPRRFLLAYLTLYGRAGVTKDPRLAFVMLRDGQPRHHLLQYLLGVCHIEGKGTPKDEEAGMEILARIECSMSLAARYLGSMYQNRKQYIDAAIHFKRGRQDSECLVRLGEIFDLCATGDFNCWDPVLAAHFPWPLQRRLFQWLLVAARFGIPKDLALYVCRFIADGYENVKPRTFAECNDDGLCTYLFSQMYKIQPSVTCYTCKLEAVCVACVSRCHRGHKHSKQREISMFCDCGSKHRQQCGSLERQRASLCFSNHI